MSTQLESPTLRHKDSYLSLVGKFCLHGEPLIPFPLRFPPDDFPALLDRLVRCTQGSEIPNGFVAHETFWLVENGLDVVGASNLRYTLTDSLRKDGENVGYWIRPSARRRGYATLILKETLLKARAHGISRALLIAYKENAGSV